MAVDYYNILKVSRTATEDDLRKVYKRLAMKWHPDKNTSPGAEAKFKQISEAYEVLSNPQSRQIYDLYGEEALKSGQFTPPFQSEKAASNPFNPRDAEDIFNDFFGGSDFGGNGFRNSNRYHNQYHQTTVTKKAAAVENKLVCSLEELYKGSKRKMKISRIVPDDSGKAKTVEEILAIEIKPGWKKGTKITFPEKGNQEAGFAAGDLIFVVDEKAHGVFKRDGNDLVFNRRITLLEALTGTTLSIITLDGRSIPIPIKDVVKPGHELMIPNEGMPISKEPGKRGNLRIKFDIKFPSKLSADQKSDLKKVLGGGGGG